MAGRVAFALLTSSGAVLVLFAAIFGSNPWFTAALLAGCPLVMLWSGRGAEVRVGAVDALFAAFVAAAAVSVANNGLPPAREVVLFGLSLLAYPAGRVMAGISERTFMTVTAVIVVIGTAATAVALVWQWSDPHGKPVVFGFGHAATVFLVSFGFLLLAVVCFGKLRRLWLLCVVVAVPTVIFAASQIRLAFLALGAALFVAFLASGGKRRWSIAVIMAVLAVSIVAGLSIRSPTSAVFLRYALHQQAPVGDGCGETRNSIAIREKLLGDAVSAVPSAGFFGHGLSWFSARSCFRTDPHNIVLQAAVEFGWLGSLALVMMAAVAALRTWFVAVADREAMFALCGLAYVAVIDMASGQLATSGLLFLFTGYAAQLSSAGRGITLREFGAVIATLLLLPVYVGLGAWMLARHRAEKKRMARG